MALGLGSIRQRLRSARGLDRRPARRARARGAFLLRSVLAPPWGIRIQDEAPLTVVAVVQGSAHVLPDSGTGVRMGAGDVAVLRGPDSYTVADQPGTSPDVVIHP